MSTLFQACEREKMLEQFFESNLIHMLLTIDKFCNVFFFASIKLCLEKNISIKFQGFLITFYEDFCNYSSHNKFKVNGWEVVCVCMGKAFNYQNFVIIAYRDHDIFISRGGSIVFIINAQP
jgi:hypothetical protein